MTNLLNLFRTKYYLNLGEYSFSPVMECSGGIALSYSQKIREKKISLSPLVLSFPDKAGASLWLSILLLRNYMAEEFVDLEADGVDFKRGEKVMIFNCIGQVQQVTRDKILLKFKDQDGIPINKRLRSQLTKVRSSRELNLKRKFQEEYKLFKKNQNPVFRILDPNETSFVNSNNLKSKILLVAGRNNSSFFRDLLEDTKIYNEPLSTVFKEEKNIVIVPNLKNFKPRNNDSSEFGEFKNWFEKFANGQNIDIVHERVKGLLSQLENDGKISFEFHQDFEMLYKEYREIFPRLQHVYNKYPGFDSTVHEEFRAVIINDIHQIQEYPNTINEFLTEGIPVIFIANRYTPLNKDINFYTNLFKSTPNCHRINWNRTKISGFLDKEIHKSNHFLDKSLWNKCIRFSNQQISIIEDSNHPLDKAFSELIFLLKSVEGRDRLKRKIFDFIYPAFYAHKNSISISSSIEPLISKFIDAFNEMRTAGVHDEIFGRVENIIDLIREYPSSNKTFEVNQNLFAAKYLVDSLNSIIIPQQSVNVFEPSSVLGDIVFSGYPYREFSDKWLLKSACQYFIPAIQILCWPKEGQLTYEYLRRRIKAGYFTDNISEICVDTSSNFLRSERDIDREIDNILDYEKPIIKVETDGEDAFEYFNNLKYKGYGQETLTESSYTIKCDIVHFADSTFMFLPDRSSILTRHEDAIGHRKISNCKFTELSPGDEIFIYTKNRSTYREISKDDINLQADFAVLETWREALEKVFSQYANDIQECEKKLIESKQKLALSASNPNKTSIQRWLFDDEMIMPKKENVAVILDAAGIENSNVQLAKMEKASKRIIAYTIRLSSEIRQHIAKQGANKVRGNETFSLNIFKKEIPVEVRTIIGLEKKSIPVEYRNTRRILC